MANWISTGFWNIRWTIQTIKTVFFPIFCYFHGPIHQRKSAHRWIDWKHSCYMQPWAYVSQYDRHDESNKPYLLHVSWLFKLYISISLYQLILFFFFLNCQRNIMYDPPSPPVMQTLPPTGVTLSSHTKLNLISWLCECVNSPGPLTHSLSLCVMPRSTLVMQERRTDSKWARLLHLLLPWRPLARLDWPIKID